MDFSLVAVSWVYSLVVGLGLIAVASLIVDHGPVQGARASSSPACGLSSRSFQALERAQELRLTGSVASQHVNLARPGLEPMCLVLAGMPYH